MSDENMFSGVLMASYWVDAFSDIEVKVLNPRFHGRPVEIVFFLKDFDEPRLRPYISVQVLDTELLYRVNGLLLQVYQAFDDMFLERYKVLVASESPLEEDWFSAEELDDRVDVFIKDFLSEVSLTLSPPLREALESRELVVSGPVLQFKVQVSEPGALIEGGGAEEVHVFKGFVKDLVERMSRTFGKVDGISLSSHPKIRIVDTELGDRFVRVAVAPLEA